MRDSRTHEDRRRPHQGTRLAGTLLGAALALVGCGGGDEIADRDARPAPYAAEYPAIGYATKQGQGRVARFVDSLERGDTTLPFHPERGYLDAVLAALDIDVSSQVLVFSRTSLQTRHIHPMTPRAIYFNDDTYVAWARGAPTFEIASFDPELGPVFHSVANSDASEPAVERELATCLRCHDTYGLSGGGVPRFLLGSGYIGTDGELVSHEAWILTSQATPLRSRWGGWYVTGRHGDQVHLGNIVVERIEDLQDLESLRVGNIDDLGGLFDSSAYLAATSDIAALMVLEHQVDVQNAMSRLRFEAVSRLAEDGGAGNEEMLATLVEPLVRVMLMVDEATLSGRIEGGSGFTERFESQGPFDAAGRSLREFDLETRLFRYPLSYLIYSDAFQALPDAVKSAAYARLRSVLDPGFADADFAHIAPADREAIVAILSATLPEMFAP